MIDITGMKKSEALTSLIRDEGMDYVKAEAYWKDKGSKASVGFAAGFYETLAKGKMDDETFTASIDAGSKNVQNHRSHYNAIRLLVNGVHDSK